MRGCTSVLAVDAEFTSGVPAGQALCNTTSGLHADLLVEVVGQASVLLCRADATILGGMTPRENYLEAIRFGRPEWVPRTDEPVWHSFQFDGNFRRQSWTDAWGVGWEVGLEGTVPFPKGNPLPSWVGTE